MFLRLVREGIGAKVGKLFLDCTALVQHTGSVTRTKRRLAHRAFVYAVRRLPGCGAGQAKLFSVNVLSAHPHPVKILLSNMSKALLNV